MKKTQTIGRDTICSRLKIILTPLAWWDNFMLGKGYLGRNQVTTVQRFLVDNCVNYKL